MTREEFYKLTDILNSEVLGNFMHGGEADELIAMYEEAVEHSNILEQEKPSKFDAAIQEGDDVRYNEDLGCRVNLSQLKRVAKKEEPISKEIGDYDHKAIIESLYSELKEEPVSDDLEEAATLYAKEEYSKRNPATLPNRCVGCYAPLMYAFKAGAKWQKEQLMAKAVETTFNVSLPSGLCDKLWIKGYKVWDKLLVIKKDEL